MSMITRFFLMISYLTVMVPLYAKENKKNFDHQKLAAVTKKDVSIIESVESTRSFISYVKIGGIKYLLKQKKAWSKQSSVIRDALAAWIAKDLGIAHSVCIISSKKEFPGKRNMASPAVLLSIAPGKTIRSQPNSKYYHLSLKQRKKIDGIFSPDRWFTETIVHQMTWHHQLPIVIALDLFICNTDRHRGNLFYDPTTDTFCAIDMDNIFKYNLPAIAITKLKLMIVHKKEFTREEIKALTVMKNTIQFLLNKYSVDDIINKLYFFVEQAQFSNDSKFTASLKKKIAHHKKIIIESRVSLKVLVSLLERIIRLS